MSPLPAVYFDGQTARPQPVVIDCADGQAVIRGAFGERRERLGDLEVSEPLGRGPRLIRLPAGGLCEVADGEACRAWLAEAGLNDSVVARLQGRWRWAMASLAALVATVTVIYLWGLPAAGQWLAPRVPTPWVDGLSHKVLDQLDGHLLKPSRLSPGRQQQILGAVTGIAATQPGVPAYRLLFRHASLGPNAFALPNGDIVVFDELVALAANDDEVAAVVAHEIGHVAKQHGLRQMIQSSVVSFVVGMYLGDVSSVATGLGALLLESRYSRGFESEADAFAGRLLQKAGKSPMVLAHMLERLEQSRGQEQASASGGDWLSSHPETARRIAALQAMR